MKYKILKGTKLFNEIIALNKRMEEARKEIRKFVESIGAEDFGRNADVYLVGLSVVKFSSKPDGWRSEGSVHDKWYMPKASNKKARDAIQRLPKIKIEELNDLVGYDQFVGRDLTICHRPGVHFGASVVLIEVAEEMEWYKPVKDMIEITGSEFNKIKSRISKKK